MKDSIDFESFVELVKLYYRLEYENIENIVWEDDKNESLMFEAFEKGYTVQDCCGALKGITSTGEDL